MKITRTKEGLFVNDQRIADRYQPEVMETLKRFEKAKKRFTQEEVEAYDRMQAIVLKSQTATRR